MYVIKNRLAFIAHPRTGSRACAETLLDQGAVMVEGHHGYSAALCEDIKEDGGIVACVGRNMFDVMVSWWHNANYMPGTHELLKNTAQPFGDYLEEKSGNNNHRWFNDPLYHYGLPLCNWVIPYEKVRECLRFILLMHNRETMVMPTVGASKRVNYQSYYMPRHRQMVEDRWGEDLKLTRHKWED